MARRGRPRSTEPALAYDVRRYLTLIQVLAVEDDQQRHMAIKHLCECWQVQPAVNTQGFIQYWATVNLLAQHVVQYHRLGE